MHDARTKNITILHVRVKIRKILSAVVHIYPGDTVAYFIHTVILISPHELLQTYKLDTAVRPIVLHGSKSNEQTESWSQRF